MQQLKKSNSGGSAMSKWAQNKSILQDAAVDEAMAKAKTDMLYAKYLEQEQYVIIHIISCFCILFNALYIRKKWKQQEITYGPRPTIQDADPYKKEDEQKKEEETSNKKLSTENTDYDSLDELEKELFNDDDKELQKIHERRKEQLKKQWKKKQNEMAQVIIYILTFCILALNAKSV